MKFKVKIEDEEDYVGSVEITGLNNLSFILDGVWVCYVRGNGVVKLNQSHHLGLKFK